MITIVVGGQYGGEGKGKVTAVLATKTAYDFVCRSGGVNSCHSIIKDGILFQLRMMPTSSVVDRRPTIVYGAGTLIHIETLLKEISQVGYDHKKILIDVNAGIVSEDCIIAQQADVRYEKIGSTLTGTGYASAFRAQRKLKLARDYPELRFFLADTALILNVAASKGQKILIEGHQGAGLSNYHGDYPYVSSRDCISAALLSELGLGLRHKVDVWLVAKSFPTRNHNGNLEGEITESEANARGIKEFGGGSWEVGVVRRRVGTIDYSLLRRAVMLNGAHHIALTCMDYWDKSSRDCTDGELLSSYAHGLIDLVRDECQIKVDLVSTGPDVRSHIFLNSHKPNIKPNAKNFDQMDLELGKPN